MKFREEYKYINPTDYIDIFSQPKWYLQLQSELKEYFWNYEENKKDKPQEWVEVRKEFVKMVYELLNARKIALGDKGENWDKERLPIDTIVIHHTSTPPDTPIIVVDALGLIRIYAYAYSKNDEPQFGLPIWSNHFYKEKQTFIAYHYLIKQDGTYEQTLKDEYIGWHCGNHYYNARSIGISFLDDLKEKGPTQKAIQTANVIIEKYQPRIILGHGEIKPNTTCPGNLFLGDNGWRNLLISGFARQWPS